MSAQISAAGAAGPPTLAFPPEPVSGFHVALNQQGDACAMVCSGQLDSKDPTSELQPQLLAFHDRAVAAGLKTVDIDVTQVQYMNSSAIKCFMTWFLKLQRAQGPYQINIHYDPKRTWQYVSFTTMSRIAPTVLKTVVKIPAAPAAG